MVAFVRLEGVHRAVASVATRCKAAAWNHMQAQLQPVACDVLHRTVHDAPRATDAPRNWCTRAETLAPHLSSTRRGPCSS